MKISLAPFSLDERAERVYGILEILHESRFGPYGYKRYFDEPVDHWLYFMMDDAGYDLMPCAPGPLSEANRSHVWRLRSAESAMSRFEAEQRNTRISAASTAASQLNTPTTFARGSPETKRIVISLTTDH